MILYSPAKINIGLHILKKRDDSFHDLSSLMYPLPFCDMIEVQADFKSGGKLSFSNTGIIVPGPEDANLCSKAIHLFTNKLDRLMEVKLHLHKQIPFGAGLGGGSSNASTVLTALNRLAGNPLDTGQLVDLATQLGSDCPLFIYNKPMMASGRGDILEETSINLDGYFLVLLNPDIVIPTVEAYCKVKPNSKREALTETMRLPVTEWKKCISNDFENYVFLKYPGIEQLKNSLYDMGAIYASMSGSGSSVYGLYKKQPPLTDEMKKFVCWKGWL